MIGIHEKDSVLKFNSSDAFWVETIEYDLYDRSSSASSIHFFDKDPKYDRQTELPKILKAILSRLFRKNRRWPSLEERIVKYLSGDTSLEKLQDTLSNGFTKRLSRVLVSTESDEHLTSVTDLFECRVSSSDLLKGNMIYIQRSLVDKASIFYPNLRTYSVVLRKRNSGEDILVSNQDADNSSSKLDNSGIIKIGSVVSPGDILVRISSPTYSEGPTPEQKLLRAIFGDTEQIIVIIL